MYGGALGAIRLCPLDVKRQPLYEHTVVLVGGDVTILKSIDYDYFLYT